jgi:hypothetical protein
MHLLPTHFIHWTFTVSPLTTRQGLLCVPSLPDQVANNVFSKIVHLEATLDT